MKIVITGVSGFCGNLLAEYFLQKGYEVAGVARNAENQEVSKLKQSKNFTFIKNDLSRGFEFKEKCDAYIHAAAQAAPGGVSIDEYIDNNICATRNIARAAQATKTPKVFFFSSLSVYGEIDSAFVRENIDRKNLTPYGMSKCIAEGILEESKESFATVAMRFPGIVGKGAKGPWLAKIVDKMKNNQPIKIFNAESPFNNVVHINDVGRFIENQLDKPLEGFEAVNFAACDPLAIQDIIACGIKKFSSSSSVTVGESEKKPYIISTQKLTDIYGYKPMSVRNVLDAFLDECV